MTDHIKVTRGSGNVFADIGVKDPEEALAKAELAARITETIRARKLTQTAAAELLGVDQPKVSKLVRGDLYGFSSDQLFRFLTALGQDVEITVTSPPRFRAKGRLKVRAA